MKISILERFLNFNAIFRESDISEPSSVGIRKIERVFPFSRLAIEDVMAQQLPAVFCHPFYRLKEIHELII